MAVHVFPSLCLSTAQSVEQPGARPVHTRAYRCFPQQSSWSVGGKMREKSYVLYTERPGADGLILLGRMHLHLGSG